MKIICLKKKTKQNSAHNNLFLRLTHNPQVKKVCHCIYRQLFFAFVLFCFLFVFFFFPVDLLLYYDKRGGRRGFFFFCKIFSFSVTWNFSFKNIIYLLLTITCGGLPCFPVFLFCSKTSSLLFCRICFAYM